MSKYTAAWTLLYTVCDSIFFATPSPPSSPISPGVVLIFTTGSRMSIAESFCKVFVSFRFRNSSLDISIAAGVTAPTRKHSETSWRQTYSSPAYKNCWLNRSWEHVSSRIYCAPLHRNLTHFVFSVPCHLALSPSRGCHYHQSS